MQNFHILQDTPDPQALGACSALTFTFDATEYRQDLFLNSARADVDAIAVCIVRALSQDAQIRAKTDYELIDWQFPENGDWHACATITLVTNSGKSAVFTFAVFHTIEGRRYDFESVSTCLRNINLERDVEQVFQHLAADVMNQLS